MISHFLSALFLLIAAGVALWIAHRWGFFRLSKEARLASGVTFLALCASFILYFGLQLGLGYGAHILFAPQTLLWRGWLQIAIVSVAIFALLLYQGRKLLKRPLTPHIGIGALTFLLAFPLANGLGQLVEGILTSIVGPIAKEQAAVAYLRALRAFPTLFGVSTVITVVFVPIAEEILFRGVLQGWLRTKMRAVGAIVASSLIFTLVHLAPSQGWTNITLLAVLFPLALGLGYLYERQRSLWAPIALHGVFNGVTILGLLAGA